MIDFSCSLLILLIEERHLASENLIAEASSLNSGIEKLQPIWIRYP